MSNATPVIERYEAALAAVAALDLDVLEMRTLDEETVLRANELHAQVERQLGAAGAVLAGDLAHRSRPELGGEGLARRMGLRTVGNLLKKTTGGTREHVVTALKTGALLVEIADDGTVDANTGEVFTASQPWMRAVAVAVAAGSISPAASSSIASGLGQPNSSVTALQLEAAARKLVAQALSGVDSDLLFRNARDERTELDLAGVALREEEQREQRGIIHFAKPTGGGRAIWDMDPENYATFVDAFDRMTSPKLGGVRFIDPVKAAQAERIDNDSRTPRQLALDGFMHLIVAGGSVDDSEMLGSGAPVIRVTVAAAALQSRVGLVRIDGQHEPVSLQTAERLMCAGETLTIAFDPDGHYLESNSDSRLYNKRQREILAAKFGGCMDPACDRPPSWTEAHHIRQWARDEGKTLVNNGILLCKHHHLLYHNHGYEIELDDHGNYWKIPPASVDPAQTPIPMPLKTRNLRDLAAATQRMAS